MKHNHLIYYLIISFLIGIKPHIIAQGVGVDGGDTANFAPWSREMEATRSLRWWRMHLGTLPEPETPGHVREQLEAAGAVARTYTRPVMFLRWEGITWQSGVRHGMFRGLPLDLREAFARGRAHGRTYGALVSAFEIENEPDIDFVSENPETYMAFLKSLYLGIHQGVEEASTESHGKMSSPSAGSQTTVTDNLPRSTAQPLPLVIMAPLALPPGPYLERLADNGLFSYTDGFNYHYYGYAEDFTGVYRQFEKAVMELGDADKSGAAAAFAKEYKQQGSSTVLRDLPIFLTEYAYGSLIGEDRNTAEGRVRQWRWFNVVAPQIRRLRIAGPMAFYLPPYFEGKAVEFGLLMGSAGPGADSAPDRSLVHGPQAAIPSTDVAEARPTVFKAGGLLFSPRDFDDDRARPWMERIGTKIGENEMSPALAWLLDYGAKHSYRPRDWVVEAPQASPIVLDFISGETLLPVKRYGGYLVKRDRLHGLVAGGDVVIYNFSNRTVNGRFWMELAGQEGERVNTKSKNSDKTNAVARVAEKMTTADGKSVSGSPDLSVIDVAASAWHSLSLSLAPGERRIVPVSFTIADGLFASKIWRVHFASDDDQVTDAVFSTKLYPEAAGMRETVLMAFDHPASLAAGNRALLEERRLALEETPYATMDRWRVTQGVSVSEPAAGIWRFKIERAPTFSYGTSSAELPLPDNFEFPDDGVFMFSYRLASLRTSMDATALPFDVCFRTANGNLYQVWPRAYAQTTWAVYMEAKENYTMGFYNRAALPWRFRDNRPVALVFRFRPGDHIPIIYEIAHPRIGLLEKK